MPQPSDGELQAISVIALAMKCHVPLEAVLELTSPRITLSKEECKHVAERSAYDYRTLYIAFGKSYNQPKPVARQISLRKRYATRAGELVKLHGLDPRTRFQLPVKGRIFWRGKGGRLMVRWGSWTPKGVYGLGVPPPEGHPDDLFEIQEGSYRVLHKNITGKDVTEE